MNGRPWRESDDAELTRLRGEGLTCAVIGAAIGRTTQACRRRGQRLRLPAPPGWTADEIAELDRLRAAGETWGAIGAALGRSEQAAKSWASVNGRTRRTTSEAAPGRKLTTRELLHLYGCALTHRAIGAQLGRTAGACEAAHERALPAASRGAEAPGGAGSRQ